MKKINVLFFLNIFFSSFVQSSQISSSLKQTSSNEELSSYFTQDVISSGEVTPSANNLPYVSSLDNLSYKSFLDAENYEGLVDRILENQPEIYQSRGMTKEQMKMYLLLFMNQIGESGLFDIK